jgi:type II secretory pathway component PulF
MTEVSVLARVYRPPRSAGQAAPASPVFTNWGRSPLHGLFRLSAGRLANYLSQVGDLINAGLTMHDAMGELASHAYDGRLRRMSGEIAYGAAQGMSLAEQLRRYPQLIPPHVRGMLLAGERAGALPRVCWEMAEDLRQQQGMRWKVAIGQAIFGLLFFLALLVPGLPRLINVEGADVAAYGAYLLHVVLPVLVGFIVVWNGAKLVGSIPALAGPVQRLLYYLPGAGQLIRGSALSRMAVTLDALLKAGVEIQEGLALAAESSGNSVIAAQLSEASGRVRRGQPMAEALKGVKFLPPAARESLALGERAGSYERVLAAVAEDAKAGRTRALWIVGLSGYGVMLLIAAVVVILVVYAGFKGYVEALLTMSDKMTE